MARTIDDFIKEIKELTVKEIQDRVTAMEKEFDFSTSVMPGTGGPSDSQNDADGDKSKKLTLKSFGSNKFEAIKIVRELSDKGLMEAKTFVEKLPGVLKEEATPEEVKSITEKFKVIGAEVSVE